MLKNQPNPHKEVALYMENAHEMINVAIHNQTGGFYSTAINRAYYAIFYAASTRWQKSFGNIAEAEPVEVVAATRRLCLRQAQATAN